MTHIIMAIVFTIAAVIFTPFIIGSLLPRTHVVSISETISVSAPELFAFIADIDNWPNWRSDVEGVTRVDENGSRLNIESNGGALIYEVNIDFENMAIKSKIITKNIPYGGEWIITVKPESDHISYVSVTESGFVDSAIWRFVGRFIIGYKKSAKRFLADLTAACGVDGCETVIAGQ